MDRTYQNNDAFQSEQNMRDWLKLAKTKLSARHWNGAVFSPNDRGCREGFFRSVQEYLEEMAGVEPELFVWGSRLEPISLDVDLILESALEEMFDGAEDRLVGVEELKSAIARFNQANQNVANVLPDYSIAIVLIPDYQGIYQWIEAND